MRLGRADQHDRFGGERGRGDLTHDLKDLSVLRRRLRL